MLKPNMEGRAGEEIWIMGMYLWTGKLRQFGSQIAHKGLSWGLCTSQISLVLSKLSSHFRLSFSARKDEIRPCWARHVAVSRHLWDLTGTNGKVHSHHSCWRCAYSSHLWYKHSMTFDCQFAETPNESMFLLHASRIGIYERVLFPSKKWAVETYRLRHATLHRISEMMYLLNASAWKCVYSYMKKLSSHTSRIYTCIIH